MSKRPLSGAPPPVSRAEFERLTYLDWSEDDGIHRVDSNLRGFQLGRPDIPTSSSGCALQPAPGARLGILDTLPLELMHDILRDYLDLRSLETFRRASRRTEVLVRDLSAYRLLKQHAPQLLRAMLAVGVASRFTAADAWRVLCSPSCEAHPAGSGDGSGDDNSGRPAPTFGGYIYLLTCTRACFLCLASETRYSPMTAPFAERMYGLGLAQYWPPVPRAAADRLKPYPPHEPSPLTLSLPHLRVVPGYYSVAHRPLQQDQILVDRPAALAAGVARHGSMTAMQAYVDAAETARAQDIATLRLLVQVQQERERAEARREAAREAAGSPIQEDGQEPAAAAVADGILPPRPAQQQTRMLSEYAMQLIAQQTAQQMAPLMAHFQSPATMPPAMLAAQVTQQPHVNGVMAVGNMRAAPRVQEHDSGASNPMRFAAVSRVPWVDLRPDPVTSEGSEPGGSSSTGRAAIRVEFGAHCLACRDSRATPHYALPLYSPATFAKHLADYGPVVDGRHQKDGAPPPGAKATAPSLSTPPRRRASST